MEAVQESPVALTALFGIILVSAQIFEAYALFNPCLRSVTKFACSTAHRWRETFRRRSKNIIKVFRDFKAGHYYIPWSQKTPIIVRSPDHMQELSEAPELSQRAVYADIFGFQYTMKHGEMSLDPNEQAAHRYRLFSRAIKVKGLAQIEALQPYLQRKLEDTLIRKIDSQPSVAGWTSVKIAPLARDLASGMLSVYFFGEKLSEEPEFASALLRFYHDVIACMGALQVVPNFMASFVHSLISKRGQALHSIFERLDRAMSQGQRNSEDKEELDSMTLFHNLIESSKDSDYWTPNVLIQAVVGIWFAASHQPWINLHFLLLELCARPEYARLIRQEIKSQEKLDYVTISSLPILDSFIKESVRLNPLDLMSIRRKALKPFQFANDGPRVETGQIACVSAYDILHDETKYPNPRVFDGLRFVPKEQKESSAAAEGEEMRGTTLTEGTKDFPIWGFGSKICPGRWHGALVIKMAVIELVTHYEFRMEDEKAKKFFFWETFQMPYESTRVCFKKRVD